MKASRAARRRQDEAGAEIVGALILFGVFVTVIAVLNITAVPAAGLAGEQEHYEQTLATLNGLQSEAETAGLPGNTGSTVARSIELAPRKSTGQDFFSFFLATPARASGELTFVPDHGNLSVVHNKSNGQRFNDIGGSVPFPVGRLTFDPHPAFRSAGVIQLENGGLVVTEGSFESMRFDPAISLEVDPDTSTTHVAIKARVLNGTSFSIGGVAPVRVVLQTEAATLSAPASNNAADLTMRFTTTYADAWADHLDRLSRAAGLSNTTVPPQYTLTVEPAAGGLETVVWEVFGTGASNQNDVRLSTGLAVYRVTVS